MKRVFALLWLMVALLAAPSARGSGASITQLLRLPIPNALELCGEPVPLAREDTLERLDLELVATVGNPVTTAIWLKRIPRYLPLIEKQIRAKKLPEDLKYVSLVESSLRASAISWAGAVGPWQFTSGTGSECGLDQTGWRDQRRDWEDATRAALDHLADLRALFGSWPLALAAYNAGKARIFQALRDQGETDFYGLRLPRETERYIFQILAAKLVVSDPGAYGIELEGSRPYPPLETAEVTVQVPRATLPVAAVAQAAGVSYRWFVELNPWIVGSALPKGVHEITVPAASKAGFERALALWESKNPEPDRVYYRVRAGDTLTSIAKRHNVGLDSLRAWNNLSGKSLIRPGQKLLLLTSE